MVVISQKDAPIGMGIYTIRTRQVQFFVLLNLYVCVMMGIQNAIYARKDPIARMLHQKYYALLESTEIEQGKLKQPLAKTAKLGKSHCKTAS